MSIKKNEMDTEVSEIRKFENRWNRCFYFDIIESKLGFPEVKTDRRKV